MRFPLRRSQLTCLPLWIEWACAVISVHVLLVVCGHSFGLWFFRHYIHMYMLSVAHWSRISVRGLVPLAIKRGLLCVGARLDGAALCRCCYSIECWPYRCVVQFCSVQQTNAIPRQNAIIGHRRNENYKWDITRRLLIRLCPQKNVWHILSIFPHIYMGCLYVKSCAASRILLRKSSANTNAHDDTHCIRCRARTGCTQLLLRISCVGFGACRMPPSMERTDNAKSHHQCGATKTKPILSIGYTHTWRHTHLFAQSHMFGSYTYGGPKCTCVSPYREMRFATASGPNTLLPRCVEIQLQRCASATARMRVQSCGFRIHVWFRKIEGSGVLWEPDKMVCNRVIKLLTSVA